MQPLQDSSSSSRASMVPLANSSSMEVKPLRPSVATTSLASRSSGMQADWRKPRVTGYSPPRDGWGGSKSEGTTRSGRMDQRRNR